MVTYPIYIYIHRTQPVPVNIPRGANYEIKFIGYRLLRWILKEKKKEERRKKGEGKKNVIDICEIVGRCFFFFYFFLFGKSLFC